MRNSLMATVVFVQMILGALTYAEASETQIQGRSYSSTGCSYYSTSLADLNFNYYNPKVTWGSKVYLTYGMRNGWTNSSWQDLKEIELSPSGASVWSAQIKGITVDSRGSYYYSNVEFSYRILWPDGSQSVDNGGTSPLGLYTAEIPRGQSGSSECAAGNFLELQVRKLSSPKGYSSGQPSNSSTNPVLTKLMSESNSLVGTIFRDPFGDGDGPCNPQICFQGGSPIPTTGRSL